MPHLSEIPSEIEERTITGHWEGDLITDSGNTHLATLVDRKSRYTVILKLAGKDASSVNSALVAEFNHMPVILKKSLTWDRGMELTKHEEFTKKTGVLVYFCDPQSPWQRRRMKIPIDFFDNTSLRKPASNNILKKT